MSFVVYDVETTGLTKRFDQIVRFAAVFTDSDLNVKDRIELGCRLLPHVIPSPEAMHVTGLRIEQLRDASLPSHYEMVAEVRRILSTAAGICTGAAAQKCTTGSVVACPRSPWEGPARGATRPPRGWRRPARGRGLWAHGGKRGLF